MGLAFWGGFASGMSQTIEKNRDRKLKADQLLETQRKLANDSVAKDNESIFNTKVKAETTLRSIVEKRNKLVDGTWEGTEEQAVELWNDYGTQIMDTSNTANQYAADKGKSPIIDPTGYGLVPLVTSKIDGTSYVMEQDLATNIMENDDIQLYGDEVYSREYETTADGKQIPKVGSDGEYVYQPTGTKLRKFSDVFKSKETKNNTTNMQYEDYVKTTDNPMSKVAWTESEKQSPMLKTIQETTTYSKNLLNGKEDFNIDKAEQLEARMMETKSWKAEYDKRVQEFDKAAVLEDNYIELQTLWQGAIDSGEYKSGIFSTIGQNMAEYTGAGAASLVGLTGEQVATRLNIDTKMGDTVARYVKLISGAAATDKERLDLLDIMFGSSYKDENIRIGKFNSFVEQRKSQNTKEAKSLIRKAPATAGRYLFKDQLKGTTIGGNKVDGAKPSRKAMIEVLKKSYPDATDEEINAYVTNSGGGY